jgi:hypothetical protein
MHPLDLNSIRNIEILILQVKEMSFSVAQKLSRPIIPFKEGI